MIYLLIHSFQMKIRKEGNQKRDKTLGNTVYDVGSV